MGFLSGLFGGGSKAPPAPHYTAPTYSYLKPGELGFIDLQEIDTGQIEALVLETIRPEDVVELKLGKMTPGQLKDVVYQRLSDKGMTAAQLKQIDSLPEMKLFELEKLPELELQQLADLKKVNLERLGEQPDLSLTKSNKADVSEVVQNEFQKQTGMLGNIASTIGEANKLDDEELLKRLDRTSPGLRDAIQKRLETTKAFQKGQLTTEQMSDIFRQAAESGLAGGFFGQTGLKKSLEMRDLGKTSLDLIREGDARVVQDRQLADTLKGGTMKVGDQLFSTRDILNRRDREYEDNLASTREEERDKVATARAKNILNNQIANEEIRANNTLENQQIITNLNLANEAKRTNDMRAVQRQLTNFDIANQMNRDKAMTGRQIALANIDLENERLRSQAQLDNQSKLFDIGLTNSEKENYANLRNQETLYNMQMGNAEAQFNTNQRDAAQKTNLALRNQATALNTSAVNAAYLSNIDTSNQERSANLGFKQTETLTNFNTKNRQADATANASNRTAEAAYQTALQNYNAGSPFGGLLGGGLGGILGGLVGSIVPGIGTAVGAGLGMQIGGGIGGFFGGGGTQGQGMGNLMAGIGSGIGVLGSSATTQGPAFSLLNNFNTSSSAGNIFSQMQPTSGSSNNMTYNWLGSSPYVSSFLSPFGR